MTRAIEATALEIEVALEEYPDVLTADGEWVTWHASRDSDVSEVSRQLLLRAGDVADTREPYDGLSWWIKATRGLGLKLRDATSSEERVPLSRVALGDEVRAHRGAEWSRVNGVGKRPGDRSRSLTLESGAVLRGGGQTKVLRRLERGMI